MQNAGSYIGKETGRTAAGRTAGSRTVRKTAVKPAAYRKNIHRTYGAETVYRKRRAKNRSRRKSTDRLKWVVTALIAVRVLALLLLLALAVRIVADIRSRYDFGSQEETGAAGETGMVGTDEFTFNVTNGTPSFISDLQDEKIPEDGNAQKYIAIHFLGVPADGHSISQDGTGAHFYIYSDGTIYQSASLHKVPWQVGTAGCYEQLHEEAGNYNTIGIEMCPLCDGNPDDDTDPGWYFTTQTQEACVLLVRSLMKELDIPEKNILRHGDIVSKYCPAPYFNNNNYSTSWTWDEFRANVHSLNRKQIPDFPFEY